MFVFPIMALFFKNNSRTGCTWIRPLWFLYWFFFYFIHRVEQHQFFKYLLHVWSSFYSTPQVFSHFSFSVTTNWRKTNVLFDLDCCMTAMKGNGIKEKKKKEKKREVVSKQKGMKSMRFWWQSIWLDNLVKHDVCTSQIMKKQKSVFKS